MNSIPKLQNDSCYNFGTPDISLIQIFSLEKKQETDKVAQMNQIIFTTKGKSKIDTAIYPDYTLDKGHAIFLPRGSQYKLTALNKSVFIILCIEPFQNIPDTFFTKILPDSTPHIKCEKPGILQVKSIIKLYLDHLITYIKDGVKTESFFEIKITELILVLSRYYPTNELTCFFQHILNPKLRFTSFVLNNWQQVRNVRELAGRSDYHVSTFNKKFKETFGIPPYQWINQKRAEKIYQEIINTHKTFKSIAEENQFKSQQHFNEYCLRHFNLAPGNIRKRKN